MEVRGIKMIKIIYKQKREYLEFDDILYPDATTIMSFDEGDGDTSWNILLNMIKLLKFAGYKGFNNRFFDKLKEDVEYAGLLDDDFDDLVEDEE